MKKYDCVVVGAGNSGMIAALRFAAAGKKTLLIEQHNMVGGVATSFKRGRFEFDVSLHELCDYGSEENQGNVYKIFKKLGVDIDFNEINECFRVISHWTDDGEPMDITVPVGREPFIDCVEQYCPGSREKMEDFFDLCEMTIEGLSMSRRLPPKEFAEKYPDFLRIAAQPVNRVLDALELPQKAKDIIGVYWSYVAVDLDHVAWAHYIAMTYKYIDLKPCMPSRTAHEISTAIIERYRQLGGELWLNCRAEKFLFDGDVCVGVSTNRGDVYADEILANINPHFVYGKMIPPELVPDREKKLCAARTFSCRPAVVYFGLSRTAQELGIHDYSIIFADAADPSAQYNATMNLDSSVAIMLCHSVGNPNFEPKDGAVVTFTYMYSTDCWGDLNIEDYHKFKSSLAKRSVELLKDKLGIDIAPYIEEVEVASPWSFCRYIGSPEGNVYGYETSDWDSMMARIVMMDRDYPIKHLRTIGAAGPQGDGYSSTYIVGDLFAKLALKEMEGK